MPDPDLEPVALTDGDRDRDAHREALQRRVEDASPAVYAANREYVEDLLGRVLGDEPVPGEALVDNTDAAAFGAFVKRSLREEWLAELDALGPDYDLRWETFKRAVRLSTEDRYLAAFDQFAAARQALTAAYQLRSQGVQVVDDLEASLADEAPKGEQLPEASPSTLADRARETLAAADERLATSRRQCLLTHANYAIAEAYRDAYEFGDADLAFVSLDDDPWWHFQSLRHRRDRVAARVEWLRRDLTRVTRRV